MIAQLRTSYDNFIETHYLSLEKPLKHGTHRLHEASIVNSEASDVVYQCLLSAEYIQDTHKFA